MPDLRPATPDDTATIVALMDMASHGMARALWSALAPPGADVTAFAIARAQRHEGGFSYRNTRILMLDDAPAAMLMAWPLPPTPLPLDDIPALARPIVDLENLAPRSAFYINGLAVFPAFRRRGLARHLLANAGPGPQALIAAGPALDGSPAPGDAARALYRATGFAEAARRPAQGGAGWQPPFADWLLLTR